MQHLAQDYARQLGLPIDDLLLLQGVPIVLLAAAARGEIDLNPLAREELAARGLDLTGHWVGFAQAAIQVDEPYPGL